jgi:hypothetical protein
MDERWAVALSQAAAKRRNRVSTVSAGGVGVDGLEIVGMSQPPRRAVWNSLFQCIDTEWLLEVQTSIQR